VTHRAPSPRPSWAGSPAAVRASFWPLLLIGLITAAIYAQTAWFPFINFDDDVHIYDNPHVRTGLTWGNVQWAFGVHGPSQWHPLAWLSHQVDASLFGVDRTNNSAGGHHLVNVLLHLANVGLTFLCVQQLTGRSEPALLTAALFAVHPLNVESVVWISERRNTSSLLFVLLTLLAYLRYVRDPRRSAYLVVCLCHAAALMCKPLAVTTPCLLLLIDVWPLQRWRCDAAVARRCGLLFIEKLPLFALSLGAGVLTIYCQRDASAFRSAALLPWPVRIENALIAYTDYLWTTVWPVGLSVFYPHWGLLLDHPAERLFWPAMASAVVLVVITLACVGLRRRLPWLLLGWLWFLGTLAPMIGLLQVGSQQRADRYTYLSNLGLFIGVAASLPWAQLRQGRYWRLSVAVPSLIVLALAGCAWLQTSVWQDSVTLYESALLVNPRNAVAHHNAGQALTERGEFERALAHYEAALEIQPDYALAHYNVGVLKQDLGDVKTALEHFQQSLKLDPSYADAWIRRGSVWSRFQQYDLAIADFEQASRLQPRNPSPHYNIGLIREHLGQHDLARIAFEQALIADPTFAPARSKLQNKPLS
jgi:tetratricopeptide (TPR) repeat protein